MNLLLEDCFIISKSLTNLKNNEALQDCKELNCFISFIESSLKNSYKIRSERDPENTYYPSDNSDQWQDKPPEKAEILMIQPSCLPLK